MKIALTDRQQLLLTKVVEQFTRAGQPVGSQVLASSGEFAWGPSTIRSELASLEAMGLLAHPHTSAGRVPTDAGYRYVVDQLLAGKPAVAAKPKGELSLIRREVDEAMRVTTETLSQLTDLIAVASAPPLETATVRHVELLLLQPQLLMVVVITSTGGVTKRIFNFEQTVDPGLVQWAASYLKERIVGVGLGARTLSQRLFAEDLTASELAFLEQVAPAFLNLRDQIGDDLYFEGVGRLVGSERSVAVTELSGLLQLLEQRASLLAFLKQALAQSPGILVRIGGENELKQLRSLTVVAASYGLPSRSLGTVSVIGPTWMDYPSVIEHVRSAAGELSRFVTDIYS